MKYKFFLLMVWLFIDVSAFAAESIELNAAQTLIYDTNHLEGLEKGTEIHYDYVKSSSFDDGFTDNATLRITEAHENHRKDLNLTFLSGDKEIVLGPFHGFRTNPVIMAVLERDVREMSRMIGGGALYFRNRIREEMARDPEIDTVNISHDGKKLNATRIEFKPFINDPMIDRFMEFKQKTYSIFLAKDVPGSLVRVDIIVPAATGDEPLISESLSLKSDTK